MPDLQSPPQNKTHTWILVLLFWIIVLLFFIAGYLLYGQDKETPVLSGAELATQCGTAGFIDAATVPSSTAEETVCPDPEPEVVTFEAPFSAVSFDYRKGWHIYTMADGGTGNETMYVSIEPLSECTECSGPGLSAATITVTERKLKTGEKNSAQTLLSELQAKSEITLTRQETSADGKVNVIGWTDNTICDGVGCSTGPHQEFIFENNGHVVIASLQETGVEALAGWELFIESFDTSIYN